MRRSLAERHFPPSERSLATSIGVQANYFGWAVGTLVPLFISPCEVDQVTGGCLPDALTETRRRFSIMLWAQVQRLSPGSRVRKLDSPCTTLAQPSC